MAALLTSVSPSSCIASSSSSRAGVYTSIGSSPRTFYFARAQTQTQATRGLWKLVTASSGGSGRHEEKQSSNDVTEERHEERQSSDDIIEKSVGRSLLSATAAAALSICILSGVEVEFASAARPTGVNRPELLPKTFTPVIDVAGFLTPQQEGRITQDVNNLEEETGFKLRVLAQNYPETPGLAVKNYWKVDDNTVVFVADPNMGNILNFNVGASVDLNVPRSFWSRLAGKYGNIFFWREMGEDASIEAAVAAIGECLREPAGPYACATIK